MDEKRFIVTWKKRLLGLRKQLFSRNVAVFLFFLILSFLFWFLNNISKDMTGRINYPVRYINFPEERALVNELPDKLELTLNGPGKSIIMTKLGGNKTPIIIDIARVNYNIVQDDDKYRFFILSYSLREMFARQLRAEYEISSISPDTLYFEFDRIIRKKVPVIANVEANTQRQFLVNGDIICNPDSVEISGPKAIIDTILSINTRFERFNQLNQPVETSLVLESIKKVGISHRRTEVFIPVEQFTEILMDIQISIMNAPENLEVRLFPDKIKLQCIVALSNYNKVENSSIEAFVDMENIDIQQTEKLRVDLKNVPDFINSHKYNPTQVEYIIEKK